jgi:glutathione S-transferase
MATGLTMWGVSGVRNLRVHWMLEEMGLKYEFHPVHPRSGQTFTPEFLKINPKHKVPVLRHGPLVITESAAITTYLAESFEAPPGIHVPHDAAGRAKVNQWSFFIMTELDAHTLYVIRRHTTFKSLYAEAPTAVDAATEYFHDQLDAIAPQLANDGPYLLGERFSSADVLLVTCLDWAAEYNFPVPQAIFDYHKRCLSRPAYQLALRRTFPDPASMPMMVPCARQLPWAAFRESLSTPRNI